MCGIVGYVGEKQAYDILIKGLKRLEYRGYDSSGIAISGQEKDLKFYKRKGKVANLEEFIGDRSTEGTIGIGHTRWATHGPANDVNAHPHASGDGNLVLIHNGIIENYVSLKKELEKRGHVFLSETDTEVLIHLIEEVKKQENVSLFEAVRLSLTEVVGAYAIVVMDKNNPDELVLAKKSSPLVIGIGDNDFYVGSDATPIIEYTKNVVYLEDEEIAIISKKEGLKIKKLNNQDISPAIQELQMKLDVLEKGGYPHFMLKEIFEQPKTILDCMRGRIDAQKSFVSLGGIEEYATKIVNANRIVIIACGTSWHAGLVGEYLIEDLARIPVEVEYASEFRYRNPIINENDIVLAISQSGETADTLAAIKLAKSKGATILGICNVVGSTISRETHAGSYTHAGPEIGVASTKAFTAQVTVLSLLALSLAQKKGTLEKSKLNRLLFELESIPDKVAEVLKSDDTCKKIAAIYKDVTNALYLGRGYSFPVALEGALKLKEISYIHAEGYPAAEMKHGPIALIDEEMPVFVVATKGPSYEKVVSNIQEVKARKGKIIAVVTEGDVDVKAIADHVIEIPHTEEQFTPILATIPFQLLSYHMAVMRECDVDQPRNLAKSVTVE
ncbi:MAG: glutamine--fructose-6-phosphate transaminase (isomerizing) [Flavobacteriales bacterium]|jgi:glucosamine--fructose-6-phosphate aminotransferase (isomerizing)|tara:strand:+ start:19437 stop:21281 length:1845 start_codon:yes stop_codon:yes gene_type:complete